MDKQLLKKFFLLFSTSFVGILLICAIAVQTGFYKYKDHMALYWEDETHLANFAREQDKKQFAFINNGKVKAGPIDIACNLIGVINPLANVACIIGQNIPNVAAIAQATKVFDGCYGDSNGTVYCMAVNGVESFNSLTMGGGYFACKDPILTGTENERCKITEGLIHHTPKDEDLKIGTVGSVQKTFGLIPMVYKFTVETSRETTNLARLDLYYNDTLAQIPLIGESKAKAAGELEYSLISGIAFGEAFFNIWSTVRNISYYLIVIPVVALGFAIMFKVQINAQTQITLIKILPRLIVVMILITFSYPIAALMIQVSKPVTDIIIAVLYEPAKEMVSANSMGAAFWIIFLGFGLGALTLLTGGLALVVLAAIVGVVLLIVLFRFFMAVISTSLKLGFLISFSPLILLVSVFPGREGIIKQYFINLVAAIAGVMAIPIMLYVAFLVYAISYEIGKSNLLIQFIVWMTSMGVLWKAYDAPKIVAQAIGAKSLLAESGFGGEQQKRR